VLVGPAATATAGHCLPAQLDAITDADPGVDAILTIGGERISAGALARRRSAVTSLLAAHALGRSDRVAVVAGLGPEAAIALLGVACRSICVPVNPDADAELDAVLRGTGAKALVAPSGASFAQRAVAERLGLILMEGMPEADQFLDEDPPGDAPKPEDVALILRTSGTTGSPKLVPATHGQLVARALEARDALGLGPDDRCLCPMPLCYGHGVYTGLLFSLLTGGSVILPERFDEESFLGPLRRLSPTWYTAGATHHQTILGWLRRRGPDPISASLRFARCANAPLPAEVREELEAVLGVRVLETYGTSETGVIASETPDGPRKPGTAGTSPGVELAILDERAGELPPGTSGPIAVRGPAVFSGYDLDPDLNRRSFQDGWFLTGDRGSLDAGGFLTVEGRIDDLINRGGEKVAPAEVEAALRAHPAVADAVVFGVPHQTLGEDLAAAVQPEDGAGPTPAELRAHLSTRLARFKVPRRIVVVPDLPRGPTDKPLRRGVSERLGLGAPGADGAGEPSLLERRLTSLWGEALEGPEAGRDDDFFDIGGDSLAAVALLAAIDEELGVTLELEDLIKAPTPRHLARRIGNSLGRGGDPRSDGRSVVGVNTDGRLPPLFAIPGRHGYALRLLLVGRELGPSQPVYGLQPPGMDWHSAGIRALPEMAARHVEEVRAIQPSGPYRLLGSSFGGLLAFEMARQLERAGESVTFLGMVDTKPAAFARNRLAAWRTRLQRRLRDRARGAADPIVAAGTRTAAVHAGARHTYVISGRIACPITLFVCAAEGVPADGERRHLWAQATDGGLRVSELPGLHAQFDRAPQFSALRDSLRACLAGDEPPQVADPAAVLGRAYSLAPHADGEAIVDGDGAVYRVDDRAMHGRVSPPLRRRGKLLLRGWAGTPDGTAAGEVVVAFVDGRFVGYSTCGGPTEGVARRRESPGLRHAGFRLWLRPATIEPSSEPRVFALAPDGRASQLRSR